MKLTLTLVVVDVFIFSVKSPSAFNVIKRGVDQFPTPSTDGRIQSHRRERVFLQNLVIQKSMYHLFSVVKCDKSAYIRYDFNLVIPFSCVSSDHHREPVPEPVPAPSF